MEQENNYATLENLERFLKNSNDVFLGKNVYSTGTSSTSGLTKLYTETGSNTDGTMTQIAIKTELDKKLSLTGGEATGEIKAPNLVANRYFTTPTMVGEGDDSTYYHRVDWGGAGNNKVDFYEFGGIWNFYQNQTADSTGKVLVGSIQPDGFHGNVIGNASTATKATQDSSGNEITLTYATKTELGNKVDKVSGKSLSTNDYTTEEKNKLKGIATGATANIGTITGVKMNGSSKGTSGVVDLGTVLTGGKQTSTSNADGGSNVYTFSDGSTITVKNGSKGSTPTIKAASGTSIGSVGTPTVTASTSGATTTFTFNNLKGQKGDKGDPGVNATTTSVATTSANGLMSSTMVSKLNGIADNANNFTYTHPSYTSRTKGLYKVAVDGSGHVNDVTAVTKDDITGLGITYDDVGAASSTHNHTTSDINWKDLSMSIRPESGSDASLEVMLKAGSSTIASNILPSVGQNNPGLMSVPMFRLLNNLNNDVSNLNKTFLVNADEPSSSLQQDGDIWFKFTVI